MVLTTKQAEVMKLLLNAGENGVTFRELNKLRGKTGTPAVPAMTSVSKLRRDTGYYFTDEIAREVKAVAGVTEEGVPITMPPAAVPIRISGSPGNSAALARRMPISASLTGSRGQA